MDFDSNTAREELAKLRGQVDALSIVVAGLGAAAGADQAALVQADFGHLLDMQDDPVNSEQHIEQQARRQLLTAHYHSLERSSDNRPETDTFDTDQERITLLEGKVTALFDLVDILVPALHPTIQDEARFSIDSLVTAIRQEPAFSSTMGQERDKMRVETLIGMSSSLKP